MGAGSPEWCAVGIAGLLGWRVIRKSAMTEREREKEIGEKTLFERSSPALDSLQLLYLPFEISLFKQCTERCRCLFTINVWLPLQKVRLWTRNKDDQRAYIASSLAIRHCSRWAVQLLLVPLFRALPCNIHASSIHVSLSQSYCGHLIWQSQKVIYRVFYELVGESSAESADCAEHYSFLSFLFSESLKVNKSS